VILSNEGIRRSLDSGEVVIEPRPRRDQYTTSAVDLFLGDDFRVWDSSRFEAPGVRVELNLAQQEFQRTAAAYLVPAQREPDGSLVFPPHSRTPYHLLAVTRERVHLKHESKLAARVEGRSSFARLGLMVHLTAPTIHAGFNGRITLEMINHGPFYLRLVPGATRVCQLIFERLEDAPEGEIATGFQGQDLASGGTSTSGIDSESSRRGERVDVQRPTRRE